MRNDQVSTYEEAVQVIKEVGMLPLAPLLPDYPSLDSITEKNQWHSGTENDPWICRTRFAADGIAAYGKFIKKKAIFLSKEQLPLFKSALGYSESVEGRYHNGYVSKEAFDLYTIISQEQGIDTRVLRAKAGMKDKENKRAFDNALVELQGSLDIVISGVKEKQDEFGEKNGWSTTAYETYDHWANKHQVSDCPLNQKEAVEALLHLFEASCPPETLRKIEKILK
ncbi:AlkZ-related protein [Neobacillus sp. D3-1R]|uniref:AlkZ-related protein n=1 Tax=Neobacillus sp. D3-1R TaxID=3445778 RepID=UPI003FA041AF